jgi:hemolysin III
MKEDLITRYSKSEERLNILTHGFGLLLSIIGLPFLIIKSSEFSGFWKPASLYIFGISLIVLYAASTFYHSAKKVRLRRRLNIFDHAAIFVLIAGTYTPFTLITLEGTTGWIIFGLTWGFALIGIVLKLFFTGKYDKLSTIMYVLMGWQIVFAIKPLMESLSSNGLKLLFLGGMFYTIGAVLYSIKRLPFNHAIFHVFVVFGSLSHFFSIVFCI